LKSVKFPKFAVAICVAAGTLFPATAVSAGSAVTNVVISVDETTVELGQALLINVALQSIVVSSCDMEGDLDLVIDGVVVDTLIFLDPDAASANEANFTYVFPTIGDHTVEAIFTARVIEAPTAGLCVSGASASAQTITVVPASTSTTTTTEEESTTTSDEVPESVEDSVAATLVKAGASNGNSLAVAAVILIIAGAGFALIRRRT
jgi:hypothetical protein